MAHSYNIFRVSINETGNQANNDSFHPVFSSDGTKILYTSQASNLVDGDTNNLADIFLQDLINPKIIRISTAEGGIEATGGNYGSDGGTFSPDGNFIAFTSDANNLARNDNNNRYDIFLKNIKNGVVWRVTSSNFDNQESNHDSFNPIFSADGKKLVFSSLASNLVPDDTNRMMDLFIADISTIESSNKFEIKRISLRPDGTQISGTIEGFSLSPDGKNLVFASSDRKLVPNDKNEHSDIFIINLETNNINRISTNLYGEEAVGGGSSNPVYSCDGNFIAFESYAQNLVPNYTNPNKNIFVKNLVTGEVSLVSTSSDGMPGDGDSSQPFFSPQEPGLIGFLSRATNLVPDDLNRQQDLFYKDINNGRIMRVSTATDGRESEKSIWEAGVFSPDGKKITFASESSILVQGDTNQSSDVFIKYLPDWITPELVARDPNSGYSKVSPDTNITMVYNEIIKAGSGDIYFHYQNGSIAKQIAITDSSQVTIDGNTVIINPSSDFIAYRGLDVNYYISFSPSLIKDIYNHDAIGIEPSDKNNWTFTVTASNSEEKFYFNTLAWRGPSTEYTMSLYENILKRAPDNNGLNYWNCLLDQNTMSRQEVLKHFIMSEEYTSKNYMPKDDLILLYDAILNRSPDPEGLNYWSNFITETQNKIFALSQVATAFYNSQEFSIFM